MPDPVTNHLISGTVFDLFGNDLAGATVSLKHTDFDETTPSETSDSNGEYIINLSGLDSQWSLGEEIQVTASKTAEGTNTVTTTIKGAGGQTVNVTLAETSDFNFAENQFDKHNLVGVIPLHYDKAKVTRLRPLPVQTENPLDKYQPADDDFDSDPNYTSFTDRFGNWYIVRDNLSDGTHRYSKGSSDYTNNWDKRAELDYDYFHNVF